MKEKFSPSNIDITGHVEKSEQVGDVTYKYSANWIKTLESEDHWRLYWKQQELIRPKLRPGDSVFEIGVGSGFTANYLRSKGHHVTTFDIDEEKGPDICGNIVTHSFEGQSFDHVLAFEVFEHIPYEQFLDALDRLQKICRKSLILSVPVAKREIAWMEFKVPRIRKRKLALAFKKRNIACAHHFWELGFGGISQPKLLRHLQDHGFVPEHRETHLLRYFVSCRPLSEASNQQAEFTG